MDDHEYDVMCRFPLLSASEDFTKWTGFISTQEGKTILISLKVPQFPSIVNAQLVTDDLDDTAIRYWTPLLKQISPTSCDKFLEYLELLEAQIQQHGRKRSVNANNGNDIAVPNSELYTAVIEEVEEIGVKNVVYLSSDFKEIVVKHVDKSDREHKLKLRIPEEYPRAMPAVSAELPFPEESIKWPGRLKEIYQKFIKYLEISCPFWDDMDQLDNCVRVLDPLQPSKRHFHRRILLEDDVIIHLVFNASAPRSLPLISFAGPEKHVDAYNAAIDRDCNVWDEELNVVQNLKSLLSCEFVTRDIGSENEENFDQTPCTVCYVYNFEDELPEITCDCGALFHRQCLYDLFTSEVTKVALRRYVDCPSCQMEIPLPTGLLKPLANRW